MVETKEHLSGSGLALAVFRGLFKLSWFNTNWRIKSSVQAFNHRYEREQTVLFFSGWFSWSPHFILNEIWVHKDIFSNFCYNILYIRTWYFITNVKIEILHKDVQPLLHNQPQIYGTPLHWMSSAYSRMHIYLGKMSPLQLAIDLWNTTTLNKFHI